MKPFIHLVCNTLPGHTLDEGKFFTGKKITCQIKGVQLSMFDVFPFHFNTSVLLDFRVESLCLLYDSIISLLLEKVFSRIYYLLSRNNYGG